MDNTTLIKVLNRDNGSVGYTIPDLGNLRRDFEPGEEKEITLEELKKLSYIPGGKYIIENCLVIENEEVLNFLNMDVEPEYFYSEDDVKTLLLTGSTDQLMDALDFAPNGVIELIKSLAVKLEINDLSKRQAILEKTGFDVTKAVSINHETDTDNEQENGKQRRSTPINKKENAAAAPSGRRTAAPTSKYKIVTK